MLTLLWLLFCFCIYKRVSFDITEDKQVLAWFNGKDGEREYIILFKLP